MDDPLMDSFERLTMGRNYRGHRGTSRGSFGSALLVLGLLLACGGAWVQHAGLINGHKLLIGGTVMLILGAAAKLTAPGDTERAAVRVADGRQRTRPTASGLEGVWLGPVALGLVVSIIGGWGLRYEAVPWQVLGAGLTLLFIGVTLLVLGLVGPGRAPERPVTWAPPVDERREPPRPLGRSDGASVLARRLERGRVDTDALTGTTRVTGRLADADVEVVIEPIGIAVSVRAPAALPALDVTDDVVPERLRRPGVPPGVSAAEAGLSRVFGARQARRLWTDGRWLRADLRLGANVIREPWVSDTLELLAGLPALVVDMAAITAREEAARTGPRGLLEASAATAKNPFLRALGKALEHPRFETPNLEEVVSGKLGKGRVALRASARTPPALVFDVAWRAALDLAPGDELPGDVEADVARAFTRLFSQLRAQRMHTTGRRAYVTLPPFSGDPAAFAALVVELVRALAGFDRPPVISLARKVESDATCPYCRDPAAPDAPDVQACAACGTPHHRECLEEARGCTVLGCADRPQRGPVVRV